MGLTVKNTGFLLGGHVQLQRWVEYVHVSKLLFADICVVNCIFQRDELYFPDKARCPKIDIYEKILNIKSVINEFSFMHYTEKGTSLLTRHQKIVCKWPLALGICGHSKKMFSVNMIQDLFSKTMDLLFCAVMMGLRFMLLYLLHWSIKFCNALDI